MRETKKPAIQTDDEVLISPDTMIYCDNLVKIYRGKDIEVVALQGLDLSIERGELTAIIGNSGSGKSTFLNLVGGLDRPSAGKLYVTGNNLFRMNDEDLVRYKRETVGFVWQNNARNLLPYLSARQNVEVPMTFESGAVRRAHRKETARIAGTGSKKERALTLLDLVGLSHKADAKLAEMSGGEQQRVALAIALANEPELLLADEPTGSVDTATADYLFDVFRRLNEDFGLTIVLVTHDRALSRKVNRVISIQDGKISRERLVQKSYAERLAEVRTDDFENGMDAADIPASHELDLENPSHLEFLILDRAGRLQIPREVLDQQGFNSQHVRMRVEDGKIVLEPRDENDKKA